MKCGEWFALVEDNPSLKDSAIGSFVDALWVRGVFFGYDGREESEKVRR